MTTPLRSRKLMQTLWQKCDAEVELCGLNLLFQRERELHGFGNIATQKKFS